MRLFYKDKMVLNLNQNSDKVTREITIYSPLQKQDQCAYKFPFRIIRNDLQIDGIGVHVQKITWKENH